MAIKYLPYMPKRILNVHKRVDEGWFWDKYSANPYIGCAHACEYCYYRAKKYMRGEDPRNFSTVIKVKSNAAKLLKKELAKVERNVIYTGDYQPAETKYRLSRRMLEVVYDLGFPLHILEKSHTVLRDLDILKRINERTWCCVSFSISTVDQNLARLLEPRAPSPKRRLESIKVLSDNGILTGIVYMPIIPYITDSKMHLEETFALAKEYGASYVLPASMTMEDQQGDWFMNFIRREYPELEKKYDELYKGRYSPPWDYVNGLMKILKELSAKYGIDLKIPKPVFDESPSQSSLENW